MIQSTLQLTKNPNSVKERKKKDRVVRFWSSVCAVKIRADLFLKCPSIGD